jgi:hypothetical protein
VNARSPGYILRMHTFQLAGTACAGCGDPVDAREITWVKRPDGTICATVLIEAPTEDEQAALAVWHLGCLAARAHRG